MPWVFSDDADVARERERRESLWRQIQETHPDGRVAPRLLNSLFVKRGQRGVYRDLDRTGHLADQGVAMSVHHTGRSYADDVSARYLLYHFPKTKSGSTDDGEIQSLRNAYDLRLPVFAVIDEGSWRRVEFGYLDGVDDAIRCCSIAFGELETTRDVLQEALPIEESPFSIEPRKKRVVESSQRDPRFKFDVLRRYSGHCPLTGIGVKPMVDAAHVVEVKDGGSDSVVNGLLLEKGVHAAFDAHLWAVRPDSLAIVTRPGGPNRSEMGIIIERLDPSQPLPHPDAIAQRWEMFREESKKLVA